MFHTAGGGKGYPLHVHTAGRCGGRKGYTLHAHTTSVRKGYTFRYHVTSFTSPIGGPNQKKLKKRRTEQFGAPRLFS